MEKIFLNLFNYIPGFLIAWGIFKLIDVLANFIKFRHDREMENIRNEHQKIILNQNADKEKDILNLKFTHGYIMKRIDLNN
jgi:hypothetical protein